MDMQRNTPFAATAPLCVLGRGGLALCALLALNACGRKSADDILRGGVPARTDLHLASTLPAGSVRTVNRNDAGWRVIYRPAVAPMGAEQSAAAALCALEHKRPARIIELPLNAPGDDPGARKIDIICG